MNEKALYNTLRRMIERGQIDGMEEKLDIFYASNKITTAMYQELTKMISQET